MLTVADIWEDAQEIFGHNNERKLLRQITDAVELLANKGEVDPLVGAVDICVDGQCITLPREVETPLGVNIAGRPAIGRDELFSFHLNGPGDFDQSCDYSWVDAGGFPTYRDLVCPAKLIAFIDRPEDEGKKLRVFGFDSENRPLRSEENGVWVDGYLVPTIYGYALPDSTAPSIARITFILKDRTAGNVRLSSYENSTSTGTLLGVFEPDETKPYYRRIKINRSADWVRIVYRRRSLELFSQNDRILLHSRPALQLAMHALSKYAESDIASALAFEAQATRLLTEKQNVLTPPIANPIQVHDPVSIKLRGGDDID
jgi:hypothetical protein